MNLNPNALPRDEVITVSAGRESVPFFVHLERYHPESYLRARRGGRTVLLQQLMPTQIRLAGLSANGLRLVAIACLKTAGFMVDDQSHHHQTR